MADHRRKIQEDVRFRVMRLLQENPEMSQRALAEAVGISVGGAHYVLKALDAYILTPKGVAEKAAITKLFLVRKIEEYEALKAEIEMLQVEMQKS